MPVIARRAIAAITSQYVLSLFFDNGTAQLVQAVAQLVQTLLHTQQQVPAQYYREAKITYCCK